MKTDIQFDDSVRDDPGYDQYRTMCVAAVTSLLFGVLSLLSFLSPYLSLIPILGIVVGLFALAQIRQRPHELAGRHFARAGIGLASLLLVTSTAREVYIYLTEVPEGHERISYTQLQPEEGKVGQLIPPLAESLNGKRVFIKGYVFPGQQQHGIKKFLLVRDKGDCCFGGNPKITDRIQIVLADSQRLKFSSRLHKLAGTFRVDAQPGEAVDAGGRVYYYLDDSTYK
ncbi:MAG: DUF4190 domain-containing protein [Pirellulales bacterium]